MSKKKTAIEETPQKRVVLVGTYKGNQLTKWRGWYNYPISGKDKIGADDAAKITELWLFKGTKEQKSYKAEFVGVKTRQELIDDYGYPAKGKAHSDKYLLFKTEFKYSHTNDNPLDCDKVIVRTKDFARSPKVAKQLREYLASSDRRDLDLANMLPTIVTKLKPEQLRVCEAAVQMEFVFDPSQIHACLGSNGVGDAIAEAHKKGKLACVEICAGAGGQAIGLENAGFEHVALVEYENEYEAA